MNGFDWFWGAPVTREIAAPPVKTKPAEAKPPAAKPVLSLKAPLNRPLGLGTTVKGVVEVPTRRMATRQPVVMPEPAAPAKTAQQRRAEEAARDERRADRQRKAPPKGPTGDMTTRRGIHLDFGPAAGRKPEIRVVLPKDDK